MKQDGNFPTDPPQFFFTVDDLAIKAFPEIDGDLSLFANEFEAQNVCNTLNPRSIPITCWLQLTPFQSRLCRPHKPPVGPCLPGSPTREYCKSGSNTECNAHSNCVETHVCGQCTDQFTQCHCTNVASDGACKMDKEVSCFAVTRNCATDNTCDPVKSPNTGGCGCTQQVNTGACPHPSAPCTKKDSWPLPTPVKPVPAKPKESLETCLMDALRAQLSARRDA